MSTPKRDRHSRSLEARLVRYAGRLDGARLAGIATPRPARQAAKIPVKCRGGAMPGTEAIRPLDQPPMFAAKHLLCPVAGALALRARRQPLGCHMIFIAWCGDGLAAEAENAQWANGVADPGG